MTLKQRIDDIQMLTRILRKEWDARKEIFIKPHEVDESFYENLELNDGDCALNDGWYTLISQLGNLIGLELFPNEDLKVETLKTNPELVYNLLLEAEAFLKLVNVAV